VCLGLLAKSLTLTTHSAFLAHASSDTSSDTSSNNSSDTSFDTSSGNNDNDDNTSRYDKHIDTPAERVQVVLRAELRQLVIQMFMVLLQRLFAVHGNSHQYNNGHCNLGDYHLNYFHDSIASALQAVVCEQFKALV